MLKVVSKSALFGHNRVHRIFYRFTLSLLALTLFFGSLTWTNSAVQAASSGEIIKADGNSNNIAGFAAAARYGSVTDSFFWSGFSSPDWHTTTNWFDGGVPVSGADVSLPLRHVRHETVISEADVTVNNLTLAPYRTITITNNRTLTVNGILSLDDGNIIVSPGSRLIIGAGIARGSGYIIGEVRKDFSSGSGAFTFPVGTDSGYSPVTLANIVGAGSFTVKANDGFLAGVNDAESIQRNWTFAAGGGITSADVAFTYLDADVPAGADEAGFKFVGRSNSTNAEFTPTFLDTTTNTFTLSGVNAFSEWSLGKVMRVDGNTHVAGRALAGERGISNAVVTLTDVNGYSRPVRTSQSGEFRFENVRVGQTYIVTIRAKGYGFSPETIAITVNEEIESLIFKAQNR